MIRELNLLDIDRVNNIGSLISNEFSNIYKYKEIMNQEYARIYVYEENNNVVGFIHIEKHFEIIDIINIAVDQIYQRNNIGSTLIRYIIDNLDHEKIMLEVKEDNIKAINLYKKFGFIEISRRKKYYGDKDAIVMERKLV